MSAPELQTAADPAPAHDPALSLRREALRGHAAMLAFSAAVSGSFSLGAMVANDITPAALTTARFLLSAIILALLVALVPGSGRLGRRGFTPADFGAPWRYAVLGMLYAGYFVLMFEGLKTANPVAAGAVFTLTPLIAAGFGWLLLRQGLTRSMAAALTVGALGAVWVIFRGDLQALLGFELGLGLGIYFLGVVLHALYAPLLKGFNRGESAMVTIALVSLAGIFVAGAYGWRDLLATDWRALPPLVYVTLAYLVLLATVFSASAMQYAAQRLPASKVMAYTYLTPVWIIIWELSLGNAVPGVIVLPGILLIVGALLILLRED
ncbi:DMT family transporter [Pararhodobacter oceanensis]|uniref:EamA family transporter n=1 Tax=Pararhodobacter oceanensis TaxID=2172121 RepID=A0A2T8HRW9_9RHOB|nr:DMT family transporter [Pararhodobacter oceanensis]PVH28178.1 EamA family transporter [Pararhodobacter oceanensis]